MNQHTELPTDENVALPEPDTDQAGFFAGLSEVTWALLGTGFLLGILIGSVFIVGRTRTSHVQTTASNSKPVGDPATTASYSSVTTDASDLAEQRQQLQRELEAEKLRLEVAALRQELADLQSRQNLIVLGEPQSRSEIESTVPQTQPVAATSPGAATLTYWNQLNAIILQEGAMRAAPSGGVTASNAGAFLDARVQAGDFAATSLRELETDSVDRQALALGED
ncbi:MAG: hypothetical protein KDA52_13690, partial [Planctomycetaceae bacterium]|nr:hypothetical protein [Planctomycetaceae bacterium]